LTKWLGAKYRWGCASEPQARVDCGEETWIAWRGLPASFV
jgi:hypothetical protein